MNNISIEFKQLSIHITFHFPPPCIIFKWKNIKVQTQSSANVDRSIKLAHVININIKNRSLATIGVCV